MFFRVEKGSWLKMSLSDKEIKMENDFRNRKMDWIKNAIIIVVIIVAIVLVIIFVLGDKYGLGLIGYLEYADGITIVIGLIMGLPIAFILSQKLQWGINSYRIFLNESIFFVEESSKRITSELSYKGKPVEFVVNKQRVTSIQVLKLAFSEYPVMEKIIEKLDNYQALRKFFQTRLRLFRFEIDKENESEHYEKIEKLILPEAKQEGVSGIDEIEQQISESD